MPSSDSSGSPSKVERASLPAITRTCDVRPTRQTRWSGKTSCTAPPPPPVTAETARSGYSASMPSAGAPRVHGRVDTRHRDRRVAKGFVGDKARDLPGEPQEVGVGEAVTPAHRLAEPRPRRRGVERRAANPRDPASTAASPQTPKPTRCAVCDGRRAELLKEPSDPPWVLIFSF